jgi:hypothetical protein
VPPIRQLDLGPKTAIIYMDPPRSGGAGDSGQSRLTSELTAQLAATALPASLTSSTPLCHRYFLGTENKRSRLSTP